MQLNIWTGGSIHFWGRNNTRIAWWVISTYEDFICIKEVMITTVLHYLTPLYSNVICSSFGRVGGALLTPFVPDAHSSVFKTDYMHFLCSVIVDPLWKWFPWEELTSVCMTANELSANILKGRCGAGGTWPRNEKWKRGSNIFWLLSLKTHTLLF